MAVLLDDIVAVVRKNMAVFSAVKISNTLTKIVDRENVQFRT